MLGDFGWKSVAMQLRREAFGANVGAQAPLLAAKKSNKVCQPWRARTRFNLASVRLSKINEKHWFSYGFYTFSASSVSTPTVHKKNNPGAPFWAPRQGLVPPFGSPKLSGILRRSLRLEA